MVHAFFIGRALASAVGEQIEHLVTDGLSNLGKFDAEQREHLRQFTEEVLARAEREEAEAMQDRPSAPASAAHTPQDLQATIDNLRAEIAQVRAALQQYRTSSN
ncbi:MAG: hypothetical protein QNJ46_00740 [Leptolyngbyaceae cyanobacterium MO_188.B28]|nr:hypothetical protein [Leptolyngbyaceae cyanobacterium MO_188.B28]